MPDPEARRWFIDVAKIFSSKSTELDILGHARKLGIMDSRDLIACLQDTTSNTARKIVRLLYTPQQLLTMSGTEIPTSQRQAIRGTFDVDCTKRKQNLSLMIGHLDIAEAHKGPISNHKFNEAINGVFRSRKQEVVKKKKDPWKEQRNDSTIHGPFDQASDESLDQTSDE